MIRRKHILKMRDLTIGYKRHVVLSGINGCVDEPSLIALIGSNGAGKSTLLKTLSGELKPLSGEVYIEGKPLTSYSRRHIARLISIVSTDFEVSSGGLTVRELVGLGRHPYTGFFGSISDTDESTIEAAMQRVGIEHKASCFMGNLSDGERQKAMIARAFAQTTPIIFLDEPFSFLDPAARIEIFMMMRREALENNKLIILSTHDVAQALRMTDRLWMIVDGNLLSMSTDEAADSGIISSIYNSPFVEFSSEIRDFISKNE